MKGKVNLIKALTYYIPDDKYIIFVSATIYDDKEKDMEDYLRLELAKFVKYGRKNKWANIGQITKFIHKDSYFRSKNIEKDIEKIVKEYF